MIKGKVVTKYEWRLKRLGDRIPANTKFYSAKEITELFNRVKLSQLRKEVKS